MNNCKAILETIDEARANRVSPEKFEQTWGYSLKHHVDRMMDFIKELEENGTPTEEQKFNHSADEAQQPTTDHEVDSAENNATNIYIMFASSKDRKVEKDFEELWLNLGRILKAKLAAYELTCRLKDNQKETTVTDTTFEALANVLIDCHDDLVSKGMILILDMNAIDQKDEREKIRAEVDRLLAKDCNQLKTEEICHRDIPVLELAFRKKPKSQVH